MNYWYRLAIAAGIVLVDLAVFVVPLSAIFLAYVILYNPPWFRKFLNDLE